MQQFLAAKVFRLRAAFHALFSMPVLVASITFGSIVHAETMPTPPPPPGAVEGDVRVSLLSRPSLEPVEAAFKASGLRVAEPVLLITYDADGRPTNIDVVKSSRHRDLDRAIIEWAKQVRIATKEAGVGRLPFSLIDESLTEDVVPVPEIRVAELTFKPSLEMVLRRFASTPMSEASAEVHVDHDDTGRVAAVRLVQSSGNAALDQAILAWTKRIKLKPGAAGTGRLPFEFKKP